MCLNYVIQYCSSLLEGMVTEDFNRLLPLGILRALMFLCFLLFPLDKEKEHESVVVTDRKKEKISLLLLSKYLLSWSNNLLLLVLKNLRQIFILCL